MDSIARIHFPAHLGQRRIGRRVQGLLHKSRREAAALDRLSGREREVLVLVVQGRTSKEIARIVGVKPSTIDTYRSRIMAKLDVTNICALVRFAIRQGIVNP